MFREKALPNQGNICQYGKRETKVVNMLHFVNEKVWKYLFGKAGDGISQSEVDESVYMIIDKNPVTNTYISNDS